MPQAKALLVDSDTLVKWIFHADSRVPVIRHEDVHADTFICVPFPAVADLYGEARYHHDFLLGEEGPLAAATFGERAENTLYQWFHERLNVRYASEETCKRWAEIASASLPHENANREHVWLVAFAQELRDTRHSVSIASEDAIVYDCFAQAGQLDEIEILRPA